MTATVDAGRVERAWGDAGSVPDDPTDVEAGGALTAGDEVWDEVPPPVDEHLVHVRPTPRQRLAGLAAGEVQVPAWLTDPAVAREMASRAGRAVRVVAATTAMQAPRASLVGSWWVVRGIGRATAVLARWLWDGDMHPGYGKHQASDEKMALKMATMRAQRQRWRWSAVGGGAFVALVVVGVSWHRSVWLGLLELAAVAVGLAWLGRPQGETLLSPGVRRHEQPRLTAQSIVRALSAVGISPLTRALEKGDTTRLWRSAIQATRGGYKVWIQLPHGVVADQLVEHEQRLAAALGRPEDCVIVEPMPGVTPGDLTLYVFDRPQLTADLGPGPLATARRVSWWDPVVIGRTRLGVPHREALRGGAWFVGGRPASGKSSLCRIAAAQTALDPRALLIIVNLKGSPDYTPLRAVCHRYIAGSPETDPTVLERTRDVLRWILAECARRNDLLVDLVERGEAVSADVTPELAAKHEALRPVTVIMDEIHRLFDASDNPLATMDAELYAKCIKAVRSAGFTMIGATQLAGTESIPAAITRAARVRGCMVVGDEVSFRQIYGNAGPGAFARGGVAKFRPGTVLLTSLEGSPEKVGCHNITTAVLTQIGKRALEARERLHLLTGEAAGEVIEVEERADPAVLLRDLLVAIPHAAPRQSVRDEQVAWVSALEADLEPDRAAGWLSSELRARGVRVESQVNRRVPDDAGGTRQRNEPGVRVSAIRKALEALEGAEQD